eukprot:m.84157 g.84157  ORF g.84157 m.84157 type:complete len:91 (+) comp17774_c0_seq1:300-572(+)
MSSLTKARPCSECGVHSPSVYMRHTHKDKDDQRRALLCGVCQSNMWKEEENKKKPHKECSHCSRKKADVKMRQDGPHSFRTLCRVCVHLL